MTDIALPYDLCAAQVSWTLDRNIGFAESPISRVIQEQARLGDRWRATLSWSELSDDQAAALTAWLDQVSKPGNRALVPVMQNDMRGTETGSDTFADLIKPWAVNKFAGWEQVNLALPPYLTNGRAVVWNNDQAPGFIRKFFPVRNKLPYVFSVDIPPSFEVNRVTINDTQSLLFDSGLNTIRTGRIQALIYPQTDLVAVFFYGGNDTDQFVRSIYGDAMLHRALTVQSVFQDFFLATGGANGFPTMRSGQFFNLQTSRGLELKRLVNSCEMLGGGNINGVPVGHVGRMDFEPKLRGSIAVGNPIFHHKPVCRMKLTRPESTSTITAPLLHAFSVEFEEAL